MLEMEKLISAYSNEKATSILLDYNSIVDEFNRTVSMCKLESNVADILSTIKEIERERIKYFIKEYILIRLDKIRKNLFADLNCMSHAERTFAQEYQEMMRKAEIYADFPSKDIEVVGFIAQKNLESVKIDNQAVEIFAGDFFVAFYDDVVNYIKNGYVLLV
ncbi:hypothetical protein GINT2_001995 [Glugoides intestinalis]